MIENPDAFWDELLAFAEARSVTPFIIGPELATVEYALLNARFSPR